MSEAKVKGYVQSRAKRILHVVSRMLCDFFATGKMAVQWQAAQPGRIFQIDRNFCTTLYIAWYMAS